MTYYRSKMTDRYYRLNDDGTVSSCPATGRKWHSTSMTVEEMRQSMDWGTVYLLSYEDLPRSLQS